MAYTDVIQGSDDKAEPTTQRAALVAKKIDAVKAAKQHWSKAYKRMRDDMKFAEGIQYPGQTDDDDRVQIDIVQRHVNSRMAALYARNPKAVAERRQKLDFKLWDEQASTLNALLQRLALAPPGQPPNPNDLALMSDIQEGFTRRKMLDRVGRTLELLFAYSLDEQDPPFKMQAKQLVVRTLTTGVGYVDLDFQRALRKRPEVEAALHDATSRLSVVQRLQAELAEGEIDTYEADAEELQLIIDDLNAKPEDVVVKEGLVFTFPCATRVIPDKKCRLLEGFLGCDWVAVELPLSGEDIEETYNVDVSEKGTKYNVRADGSMRANSKSADEECAYVVWKIYSKRDGLVYTVCDGYDDFLEEPRSPNVFVEGFWPIFTLQFNKQENDKNPFPRSDVRLLRSLQKEINRSQEGLRQHRIAARPLYVSAPGAFDEDEKKDLSNHKAHGVIELKNFDGDVNKLLAEVKKASIDPNLYTPDPIYDAINRVVGSQEANLGGTSGATATESSIAEASRISSLSSNTDDLDEFLTRLARAGGNILLKEISFDTAVQIAGVGAVWPEFTNQQIADELNLKIIAGSTGRPNKAQEAAMTEKLMPFILQIPGVNPELLARHFARLLDENIDLVEFYAPGGQSIVGMNANKQLSTGDAATDPPMQGAEGGDNAPNRDQSRGSTQGTYPAIGGPGVGNAEQQ